MKKLLLVVFTVAISSVAFYAIAGDKKYSTIQSCTDLLPEGHKFTITINASVDTNEKERKMTGQLNISDEAKSNNADLDSKLGPFKACIVKIIK
ncbi:hypothetical protein FLL45_04375 [Aliikangiella marina]|uniref:Uncharacterized protein n=1 Tax=Aliikangiella marina TaxID=1712262 RepID=A0A545TIY3_9GAMM|nr:hypothetical protein [Aliikangiella marina]TQV77189.1 hypothetical protein FLL45_04375 [Aliikangiella marina]